jgi:glycosyltransferase involved in cell wall biosynthesis
MSRLSERRKVIFVETVAPDGELATPVARYRKPKDYPNLTILRLQFPAHRWEEPGYVDLERRRLVREFLSGPLAADFKNDFVQWFYDPMAVSAFAGEMGETATVYDCMDELSRFRFAPPEMTEREAKLLRYADVVFTGGRKLYDLKSESHDNCHFYGCGVDVAHFGKARSDDTTVQPALAGVKKPVLGYFGVVDERLDYELIARLADANPDWSVVIIGPVIKVEPDALPKRPNLHWVGQQPYQELPAFCKGFDVCLMPFALNEATEYINPTKALEYMAAGRIVVSSAIADVVRNFGEVVRIGNDPEEFIAHCRNAIQKPEKDRIRRGLAMAEENTWESIVGKLEEHVEEALAAKACSKRKTLKDAERGG